MNSRTAKLLFTGLFTTVLAACGSGGSGGDTNGNSNTVNIATLPVANENLEPGMVITGLNGVKAFNIDAPKLVMSYTFNRSDEVAGEGFISARMFDYSEGVSMQDHIDFFQPEMDACEILITDDMGSGSGQGSSGPARLNVGGSLSINSALPGPIPTDATLNIPANNVFPAVNGYPIHKVAAPVRLSPDRTFWVTADSLFSWIPGNNESEFIKIDFEGYEPVTGDYVENIATCSVVDDGNFELPTELDQFLRGYGNLIDAFYAREAIRLDLVDGVLFRQRNRVGE